MTRPRTGHSFEDFLELSKSARTQDELFDILQSTLNRYGYDRVVFTIVRDNDLGPEYVGHGVVQNYPMDWHAHYMSSGYELIDPVRMYVAQAHEVFKWEDLDEHLGGLTNKQKILIGEAYDAGLRHGLCVPTSNSMSKLSGIAVATSGTKDSAHIDPDLLEAYCRQFYKSFKRIALQDAPMPPHNIQLSSREHQILSWIAHGKTDEEISDILVINVGTVRFHTQSLFKKLNVHNRPYAVLKAIKLGLLDSRAALKLSWLLALILPLL